MAGKVMTKAQLVSLIAEKCGITKATANGILELIAATAVAETKKNGQFVIPGLGKLVKSQRKARMGRNPQTGAAIKIPAKTVVKFRVAKACKDAVVPGGFKRTFIRSVLHTREELFPDVRVSDQLSRKGVLGMPVENNSPVIQEAERGAGGADPRREFSRRAGERQGSRRDRRRSQYLCRDALW